MMELLQKFLEFGYTGVRHDLAGNGGRACFDFISLNERLLDTLTFTAIFGLFVFPRVLRHLQLPQDWELVSACRKESARYICGARKWLLIALTLVFGIQVGFKIVKHSWVYLLNPCHVVTLVQIYLLSSEPTRLCTAVFRVHNHLLYGGVLAILFPVLNTLEMTGELPIYWIQHVLIVFVVPPYLIYVGGAYKCEPLNDMTWPLLAVLIFFVYMMYFLQAIAMSTLVNLNNVLCPAVSDPFSGKYWRWAAFCHQPLLILVFGKIYTAFVYTLLRFGKLSSDVKNQDQVGNCYVSTNNGAEAKIK